MQRLQTTSDQSFGAGEAEASVGVSSDDGSATAAVATGETSAGGAESTDGGGEPAQQHAVG